MLCLPHIRGTQSAAAYDAASSHALNPGCCAVARSHWVDKAGPSGRQGQPSTARRPSAGRKGALRAPFLPHMTFCVLTPRMLTLCGRHGSRSCSNQSAGTELAVCAAGREHHGLLQGVQCGYAGQSGHHHPRRDHRLRGALALGSHATRVASALVTRPETQPMLRRTGASPSS